MNILLAFLFAFVATAGFTLIFNIHFRHIFFSAFTGGAGWALFQLIKEMGQAPVIACFVAACLVAALGEAFARLRKEASLVFIIPGILPLVPGIGLYRTMLSLLQDNLSLTAEVATETFLLTGSIAVGILLISSFVRALSKIMN